MSPRIQKSVFSKSGVIPEISRKINSSFENRSESDFQSIIDKFDQIKRKRRNKSVDLQERRSFVLSQIFDESDSIRMKKLVDKKFE
mgnify:CR=1 FL=1